MAGNLLTLAGVGINLAGAWANSVFPVTLYLDMVGTALVALVLGPWRGLGVALAISAAVAIALAEPDALWFAFVNTTGALVWWYGVRWGMASTLRRFALLNLIVGLAGSIVVSAGHLAGLPGHGVDLATGRGLGDGPSWWLGVVSGSVLNCMAEALVAGFVALFAAEWMMVRRRGRATRLPWAGAGSR